MHRPSEELVLRQGAAHRIRQMRNVERKGYTESLETRYIRAFQGLKYFLSHVKDTDTPRILEIGAGDTQAIRDIVRDNSSLGITAEATVLVRHRAQLEKFLGNNATHVAAAEMMRRIPNERFGGIISVCALEYSAAPILAAQEIDRILVPGGGVKLALVGEGSGGLAGPQHYYPLFERLGYDVALHPMRPTGDKIVWQILLGIKPGKKKTISAKNLLAKDLDYQRIFELPDYLAL